MLGGGAQRRERRIPDPKSNDEASFELPQIVATVILEDDTRFLKHPDKMEDSTREIFAVEFCPYQPLNSDPVFAVVSKKHVVICKLSQEPGAKENMVQTIKLLRDDDDSASNACATWVQNRSTLAPYLCIGGRDGLVKMYDVISGELVESFAGHGGAINDLTASPVNPSIFISASNDSTIRLWSIDPSHKQQPCLCIFGGEGHVAEVLTTSFHDTGHYVLSGGHDHRINMWTIPELPAEQVEMPIQVHYPHFSTSAIHGGIVDCVAFYGDQILSRACHDNVIVLWEIIGFSSQDPPPPDDIAPLPRIPRPNDQDATQFTRSAFVPIVSPQCPLQYDRRIQFHTPKCDEFFFVRFQLFHQSGQHPVLAFANPAGEIFFWDLERIRVYAESMHRLQDETRDRTKPVSLPRWLSRPRAGGSNGGKTSKTGNGGWSSAGSGSSGAGRSGVGAASQGVMPPLSHGAENGRIIHNMKELDPKLISDWEAMYSVKDRDHALEAHHRIEVSVKDTEGPRKSKLWAAPFVGRQATWSPGGEWCVVAGSLNVVFVLRRWAKA